MKFFLILPVFWPKLTKIPVGGCYRINQNCHPWYHMLDITLGSIVSFNSLCSKSKTVNLFPSSRYFPHKLAATTFNGSWWLVDDWVYDLFCMIRSHVCSGEESSPIAQLPSPPMLITFVSYRDRVSASELQFWGMKSYKAWTKNSSGIISFNLISWLLETLALWW